MNGSLTLFPVIFLPLFSLLLFLNFFFSFVFLRSFVFPFDSLTTFEICRDFKSTRGGVCMHTVVFLGGRPIWRAETQAQLSVSCVLASAPTLKAACCASTSSARCFESDARLHHQLSIF
ncbi:hypothetical protein BDV26DRAFT_234653 [Aspergillus bertholletiae]|uniref:Uncharacterized protein n=1 Tax=Aspergillus bertholletiae TaxID=1226010 RepID=A0A5N7B5J3_9EURO|nr:hypothetical protein BDV26DRAFT_234653 [Aspergillus bertholletiae]